MKRKPCTNQVAEITSRIDGLVTKMANPSFSNNAAKQIDRQSQRLHAALKILSKPAK